LARSWAVRPQCVAGMPSRDDDDDEERADLAARVKQLQRDSEEGKQQWWSFCDAEGFSNRRDPNKHTADFIRRFFDARRDGRIPAGRSPVAPPHEVDPDMHKNLVGRIKQVQRSSPDQKEQWERFCDMHGGGVRDPQRHDSSYLRRFFDEVLNDGGGGGGCGNGCAPGPPGGCGGCGGYPPMGYPPAGAYPPMGGYPPMGYPPMGYPPMGAPPPEGYPPMGAYPPMGGYPWGMGAGQGPAGAYVNQAACGGAGGGAGAGAGAGGGFSGGGGGCGFDQGRSRRRSPSRSRSRRRRKTRSPSVDSL